MSSPQILLLSRLNTPSSQSPSIAELLQPSEHPCGLLDLLQQLPVLLVLEASQGQCRQDSPFPALCQPSADAAQGTVGLPGSKRVLLTRVQLFIHQNTQIHLRGAALNEFFS